MRFACLRTATPVSTRNFNVRVSAAGFSRGFEDASSSIDGLTTGVPEDLNSTKPAVCVRDLESVNSS